MRELISHRHRCIFTHVPKTAGKSILAAFGLPMLAKQYDNSLPFIEHPYGHRRLAEDVRGDQAGYFKFAFVRNPWDRLVSAFFYLMAGGCNAYDVAFRDKYLTSYEGDFPAFVRDLPRYSEAMHFRPQADWLCDESGTPLPDFIGRYERMADDFLAVAERLSLPPKLPVLNTSRHAPYREHYDKKTREIVERAYRRDIELFGYGY